MVGVGKIIGHRVATWSLLGSLGAHVAAVAVIGWVAYRSVGARQSRDAEARALQGASPVIAIELASAADGLLVTDGEVVREGEALVAHGGAAIARVDTGAPGSGGDATGRRATNLAAMNDQMRLETDLLSRLDRDQVQRLKTAPRRTTREDRRSTTRPMELTFLATGTGQVRERRPASPSDPSRGALMNGPATVTGGLAGSDPVDAEAAGARAGASREGQRVGSPGLGLRDREPGEDHRKGARVTFARPSVTEAAPTIPGVFRGRPNDTLDSDQEVANTVRSLIQASVAGGRSGDGRGGSAGPAPDPGAGGGSVARGSVARALGAGDGDVVDWNSDDPMLMPYFRKVHARVDPLWADAFPRSARAELKQGTVILEFSIALDGTAKVMWPPVRPSGIDEFDRNCADAIRRASPFAPLPPTLREAGRTSLRIRAPFVAKNPIIK